MGREAVCTVHIDGQTGEGKALLETSDIIFRGEPRLRIPFGEITSVAAQDGTLRIEFAGRTAEFELGPMEAPKWLDRILHPPSLLDKLGVKGGLSYRTHGSLPGEVAEVTGHLTPADGGRVDLMFLGAGEAAELAAIPDVISELDRSGALWVIYPKGQKNIRELDVLNAGRAAGLVDTKVAAVSSTHTGLKFMRPKKAR